MKGPSPMANRVAVRKPRHSKKKQLRSMRIVRAKGGYTASHDYESGDGMYQPGEEHVIAGGSKELVSHVAKHFGGDAAPARSNRQEPGEQA